MALLDEVKAQSAPQRKCKTCLLLDSQDGLSDELDELLRMKPDVEAAPLQRALYARYGSAAPGESSLRRHIQSHMS